MARSSTTHDNTFVALPYSSDACGGLQWIKRGFIDIFELSQRTVPHLVALVAY